MLPIATEMLLAPKLAALAGIEMLTFGAAAPHGSIYDTQSIWKDGAPATNWDRSLATALTGEASAVHCMQTAVLLHPAHLWNPAACSFRGTSCVSKAACRPLSREMIDALHCSSHMQCVPQADRQTLCCHLCCAMALQVERL